MSDFSLILFTVLQLCSVFAFTVFPEDILDNLDYFETFVPPEQNTDDQKIVGGQEAFIEDHPYQIALYINNKAFCGGFIVSERFILTAAHCVKDAEPETLLVRAGSASRKNGTIIPISDVWSHPEYNKRPFDKDVAVMKTTEPITFSDTIQAIPLPEINRPMRGGTKVIVSGWGKTQSGANSIPERLMDVEIPVVYYPECVLAYPGTITSNMWCGGNFFFGGQGSCQGDSGGAAIQDWTAVGIVSFGRGCAQPLSPGVYANIAAPAIRNFITKHTGL